ncbi:MAG: TlpA family protein disulfide reductase [Deltaproteobacteria bacterium]|nr:TlpA family protein disulfide reductase [Deltaproteobacteria bacterium]
MMIRQPFLKNISVFGICLALALFIPHCAQKTKDPASAPDFTLKTIEGHEVALSGLRGKVVLLDFWATWCGPCKESIPHLIQLYKSYQDKGFELIGMSTDKAGDVEMVRRFVKSMDIPYPIIMTPDEVARNYKVTGLPTTVLIDKEGKVREKIVGFNSAIGQQIAARVEELTSEKP